MKRREKKRLIRKAKTIEGYEGKEIKSYCGFNPWDVIEDEEGDAYLVGIHRGERVCPVIYYADRYDRVRRDFKLFMQVNKYHGYTITAKRVKDYAK